MDRAEAGLAGRTDPPAADLLLDVSVVLYHPEERVLAAALASIAEAAAVVAATPTGSVRLWLVDNAERPDPALLTRLVETSGLAAARVPVTVLSGHGNLGYGGGHNLAIARGRGSYHLVLNHDILLDRQALVEGLRFMEGHPGVVLLCPRVVNERGEQEYLCKRAPTVLDLALRGFAPGCLRRRFAGRLARYEMRDVTGGDTVFGIEHAGGAFMLFRRTALERLGGFDERFFLYFEDFDLSKRAAAIGAVAYVPAVSMVHYGGKAARKGWRHIGLFVRSAGRYFAKHGWRLA